MEEIVDSCLEFLLEVLAVSVGGGARKNCDTSCFGSLNRMLLHRKGVDFISIVRSVRVKTLNKLLMGQGGLDVDLELSGVSRGI